MLLKEILNNKIESRNLIWFLFCFRSLCAFLNSDKCGTVYLGIRKDGVVAGLKIDRKQVISLNVYIYFTECISRKMLTLIGDLSLLSLDCKTVLFFANASAFGASRLSNREKTMVLWSSWSLSKQWYSSFFL